MKAWMGVALVATALAFGAPGAAAETKTAPQAKAGIATSDATDFSAHRRRHYHRHRYGYRPYYRPYGYYRPAPYYARPYYYQPYPYYAPAPFPFGFGFGPFWW